MSDRARENDARRVSVAVGVGKGLGKIKNKSVSWKKLKEKLSAPMVDTSVSFAQYEALTTDEKLEKKRAPGSWTPSRYSGERRKIAELKAKTLIVFDLDHITLEQLEDIRLGVAPISQHAWHMHTTRGHCPEKPRVRMVLLPGREMTPDEGNAVFRLLAQQLAIDPEDGIEIPDKVSFRGNQTMFWPSVSRDQDFWTDENVAPVVDVDELLAANPGWENFENLPYQEAEHNAGLTDPNARMEDPREKPGYIGAFCRAYRVQDVIDKWLSDIYTPSDSASEERYTYAYGSGASGAVVYEDGLFLHSHHGTDPVDTVNAYDLLRLHKFGHLDDEAHGNVSPANLPSFKAMEDLCKKDEATLAEMYSHMDDLLDDFEDNEEVEDEDEELRGADDIGGVVPGELRETGTGPGEQAEEEAADGDDEEADKKERHAWRKHLQAKASGALETTLNNAVLILENDPRFKGRLAFNEFTGETSCIKRIGSKGVQTGSPALKMSERKYGRMWGAEDDTAVRHILSLNSERKGYEVEMPVGTIEQAVSIAAKNQTFHPIKSIFEAAREEYVAKGRKSRGAIDTMFIRYLGCEDNAFTREASRNFALATVARTFEPGCKFDNVVVIQGRQGGGKSTFLRIWGRDFFVELPQDFGDTQKMVESMSEALIAEMGEMAGLRRETAERAKEFITKQVDKTRLSYDRRARKFPRKTVLTGTSNLDKILHDPTGNRRFWVIHCDHDEDNPIDVEAFKAEIDALQGEALDEYLALREQQKTGDLNLDLKTAEARRIRDQVNEAHREEVFHERLADAIRSWLEEPRLAAEVIGMGDPEEEKLDDDDQVLPARFTREDVMAALKGRPEVGTFDGRAASEFDKALTKLREEGLIERPGSPGKEYRYFVNGERKVWLVRAGAPRQGPKWMRAEAARTDDDPDDEIEDLLG